MHMGVQTRVRKCRHAGMWTASNKLERGDYRSCHFRYLTGATWTLLHSAPLSCNVAKLLATTLIYACHSQHTQYLVASLYQHLITYYDVQGYYSAKATSNRRTYVSSSTPPQRGGSNVPW